MNGEPKVNPEELAGEEEEKRSKHPTNTTTTTPEPGRNPRPRPPWGDADGSSSNLRGRGARRGCVDPEGFARPGKKRPCPVPGRGSPLTRHPRRRAGCTPLRARSAAARLAAPAGVSEALSPPRYTFPPFFPPSSSRLGGNRQPPKQCRAQPCPPPWAAMELTGGAGATPLPRPLLVSEALQLLLTWERFFSVCVPSF